MGAVMRGVDDVGSWDWELYPAGWYETFGFVWSSGWLRYLEAERKVREQDDSEIVVDRACS